MPLEVIQLEELDGVWRTKGPKSWEGCYYEYEVIVYHPSTLQLEKCFTTDPYARGYKSPTQKLCSIVLDMHTNTCNKVQAYSTRFIAGAGSQQMEGEHCLLILALMI